MPWRYEPGSATPEPDDAFEDARPAAGDTEAHGVPLKATDGVEAPGPDEALRGRPLTTDDTDEAGPDELIKPRF